MPTKDRSGLWKLNRRNLYANALSGQILSDAAQLEWTDEALNAWVPVNADDESWAIEYGIRPQGSLVSTSPIDTQSELAAESPSSCVFVISHHVRLHDNVCVWISRKEATSSRRITRCSSVSSSKDLQSEAVSAIRDAMSKSKSFWSLVPFLALRADPEATSLKAMHDDWSTLLHVLSSSAHASRRVLARRSRFLSEATLTKPEALLAAFEATDTSAQDRRTLALFTETLDFDATQQKRLLPHLWSYVLENRTSRNRDELVALGAAIRTFIAYLPSSQFDVLPELLAPDETAPVSADMELEVVKGLFYRLTWDTDAKSIPCPRLRDALYDLAMFHSSKRAVQNDISNAIAVESIIILALFNDSRVESLCKSFPQHSMPWFSRVVEVRAKHLLSRLMRENRDSTVSLGLLPVLAKSSATSNGK